MAAWRSLWDSHPINDGYVRGSEGERIGREMLEAYDGRDLLRPQPPANLIPAVDVAHAGQISVPTLVITGEREMGFMKMGSEVYAYLVPGARRAVIPSGGHSVHLQQPALVAQASCMGRRLGTSSHEAPRIVGAWTIESWLREGRPSCTVEQGEPQGRLIYAAGGQMSAQLGCGGIQISYFGTFTYDDHSGIVTHHVVGGTNAGTDQERTITFEGNDLIVVTAPGLGTQPTLAWRRVP